MTPKVFIIILNWNGYQDTIECVESVLKVTYPNFEVVIVDNASTDDSVAVLSACFPTVTLLTVPENRYYAGGNNIGIRHSMNAGAEYVMVLNNDTVVHPDFLNPLVAAMEFDPTISAAGGTLYDYEDNWLIQGTSGHFINFKSGKSYCLGANQIDNNQFNKTFESHYICGASILMRANIIAEIGLFDEAFKLYCEESDWCLRSISKGYKCMFVPESKIMHKMGASAKKIKPLAQYFIIRNKIWLINRYAKKYEKSIFHISNFLYRYPKLILGRIFKNEFNLIYPIIKGIIDGCFKNEFDWIIIL